MEGEEEEGGRGGGEGEERRGRREEGEKRGGRKRGGEERREEERRRREDGVKREEEEKWTVEERERGVREGKGALSDARISIYLSRDDFLINMNRLVSKEGWIASRHLVDQHP